MPRAAWADKTKDVGLLALPADPSFVDLDAAEVEQEPFQGSKVKTDLARSQNPQSLEKAQGSTRAGQNPKVKKQRPPCPQSETRDGSGGLSASNSSPFWGCYQ